MQSALNFFWINFVALKKLCCLVQGCCTCTVKFLHIYIKCVLLSAFMQPWAISSWGRTCMPFLQRTLPASSRQMDQQGSALQCAVSVRRVKESEFWSSRPSPGSRIASCPRVSICFSPLLCLRALAEKLSNFSYSQEVFLVFLLADKMLRSFLKPWSIADFNLQKLVS